MGLLPPPRAAAWRHLHARDGFEVAFFDVGDDGISVRGHTTAVEEGEAWAVSYEIELGPDWHTRTAVVRGAGAGGDRETRLELGAGGRWRVDGVERPDLDGILDVDLGSSSMTNAFPVRRLDLAIGESAEAPAAWVRELDLAVAPLPQSYERLTDEGDGRRFAYDSPEHGFEAVLDYAPDGLVRDYPGIAVRVA